MAFIKLTREVFRNGKLDVQDWYVDAGRIVSFGLGRNNNQTEIIYDSGFENVFESPEQILLMIESAKKGGAE